MAQVKFTQIRIFIETLNKHSKKNIITEIKRKLSMNDTHKMYPDKNYIYPLSSTNTSKIIYTKSKISNIHTCYKQEMIKKIEHKKHKQQ